MRVVELQEFYAANFDNLVKKTSNRCGNFHDAEDIVQTAFERAVKYIESCQGNVDRWFSVILSNVFKKYQNDIRLGPVTKPLEDHIDDLEPVIPDNINPILRKEIFRMVDLEPETHRVVLRLHLDFGFTIGEIKELTQGLTYSKIHDIISNFRRKVLKRYQ